jgi:hypothetical protein
LNYRQNPEGFDTWSTYADWHITQTRRLVKFRGLHSGEDCFIIGNGPSLNTMDLTPLKNYHTFGLNKIYLIFDKVMLPLSYHVAVNSLVIKQSLTAFESLPCPSFLSYDVARTIVRPLDHIYFVLTQGWPPSFHNDITQRLYEGATVTYVAMQIASYLGFRQIFLIGVDHNFTASGTPHDKQFLHGEDPNHFDPRYFQDKEWHLPDLDESELAYRMAKRYFKGNNGQICDATSNGKLQIFPKMSYIQALAMCRPKHCA